MGTPMNAAQMRALADDEWDSDDMRMARDWLRTAADELDRLCTVIESGPHWVSEHDADDCCGWYSDDNYCNCWKRGAL